MRLRLTGNGIDYLDIMEFVLNSTGTGVFTIRKTAFGYYNMMVVRDGGNTESSLLRHDQTIEHMRGLLRNGGLLVDESGRILK